MLRSLVGLLLLLPAWALAHPQPLRDDLDALYSEAEVAFYGTVLQTERPYGSNGPQLVTALVERHLRGPLDTGAVTFLTAVEHGSLWRPGDAAIFLLATRRFDKEPGFGATALREEMLLVGRRGALAAEAFLRREPEGVVLALGSGEPRLVRHALAKLPPKLGEAEREALRRLELPEAEEALSSRTPILHWPAALAGLFCAGALLAAGRWRRR